MVEIPPATAMDAEDVAWGLQTAEALWRRGERRDAIVWLRRAAQAAGEATDDDRALELARAAADLTDWMATLPAGPTSAWPRSTSYTPPTSHTPPQTTRSAPPRTLPQASHIDERPENPSSPDHSPSVLPAEHVHAGMFNPWDKASSSAPLAVPLSEAHRVDESGDDDDVITSLRPQGIGSKVPASLRSGVPAAMASAVAVPAPKRVPARPPPLPPRARVPTLLMPLEPAPPLPLPVLPKLELGGVDAFSDLPDDARHGFASAATVCTLGEGEEVSGFALAYIVSGSVDVAATMVDSPAARLFAGAVLRARGTTTDGVPMRLIGVDKGVVATWTDADVGDAFRACPWVEADLRTAADRLQVLVGVTIGPLGERLDASLRDQILQRLTMRTLAAGEIVVRTGEPIPGLLLVGVGQLELVDGDVVSGVVGSGQFLFAGEVLGAGAAPLTARAGSGGTLVLFGDRLIAQELLVTCPPLLEVFAGM